MWGGELGFEPEGRRPQQAFFNGNSLVPNDQDAVLAEGLGERLQSWEGVGAAAGGISMILQRPLKWDPVKTEFVGDEQANRLLAYTPRPPWRL